MPVTPQGWEPPLGVFRLRGPATTQPSKRVPSVSEASIRWKALREGEGREGGCVQEIWPVEDVV